MTLKIRTRNTEISSRVGLKKDGPFSAQA